MRHLKCSLCLLALSTESLGYTVLTGLKARVGLALSSKKKSYSPFCQKLSFVFPKNFTPYWAPKDVKSFSIIAEFFASVKQVWLSWVSIRSLQHNYSTQTLSSNSLHVAGKSQVMKHMTENPPQMVSKLNLTLQKKRLFVSVIPIEKARSHRSHEIRPSPVIFRLASNAFPGRSVGLKKKTKTKSQEVSEEEALVPQDDFKS